MKKLGYKTQKSRKKQSWGAEAGRSRVFLAPWSRSRLKRKPEAGAAWEKNQEPEPLEKKSGAGAAKKFAGSPALNILDDFLDLIS